MKFSTILLVLVFGLVAIVYAKFELRTKEDALRAHEECHGEFKVPDDIYEEYLNYVFPEHKRTSCYMKCFVEKMGLFTESKGFDEKAIIKQFTHNHVKDLGSVQHGLEKCIDHNEWESDACTWVYRVFSCWLKINRHVVRKTYGNE